MNLFCKKILSVFLLCAVSPCYGENIADACKIIITDGLKEYSIKTDSAGYLNTVHDKYCEASGSARTEKFGLGLDAIVQAIPVKFSGSYGSSQEGMKNFCKNYSSVVAGRTDSTEYQETTVRRAYDSFDQCVALASQSVVVRHAVRSRENFDFYIAPGFSRPIKINGLQVPANVQCFGLVPSSADVAKKFDKDTRITLSNYETLSLGCTRSGTKNSNGDTVYDEAVVTLFTDLMPNGNYSVFIPQDTKFSMDHAADFDKRLTALAAKQKLAEATIHQEFASFQNKLKTGVAPIPNNALNGSSGVCLPGTYMVGARFRSDNGGPHGIISNISPICSTLY